MPNQPKTPTRSLRAPDRLWLPLERLAKERGTSATVLVLQAIEDYLTREGIRLDD